MVTDALVNFLKTIVLGLINLLPSLESFKIPTDIVSLVNDIVNTAGFFIPLGDIALILSIFLVVTNFRFIYNILARIWDMLPFT